MTSPRDRGWEFWLGAVFVAAAVAIISLAFFNDWFLDRVSKMGAAIAALAVVGASLIAYDGAVSKVRYDRQQAIRDAGRRRTKTLLILAGVLYEIKFLVLWANAAAISGRHTLSTTAQFRLPMPDAVSHVWANIDDLPPNIAGGLRSISGYLAQVNRSLSGDHIAPNDLQQIAKYLDVLTETLDKTQAMIGSVIDPIYKTEVKSGLPTGDQS